MKNILVPISFSASSKNALQHAYLIAKQNGAILNLLHCYATEEYNRKYDFGEIEYESGIKQMLIDFFKENIKDSAKQRFNLITHPGGVSEIIKQVSHKYELLVLSRRTGFQLKPDNWFSDKIFYFITKSLCPVLLVPSEREIYSFTEIKNIWHIQRKDMEIELIKDALKKLHIDTNLVVSKTLQQKTFTSAFWRNIVNYENKLDDEALTKISESFANENIDLLILVNHRKSMFESFLRDNTFQVLSQLDIPILILQSKPKES